MPASALVIILCIDVLVTHQTKNFREQEPVIELHDHDNDPNETRNVAGEHPEIVDKLMPLWENGDTGLFDLNN